MIVAWMSYTVLVSLLLFAGAVAAEFVCRALRWPTRSVWIVALWLSAALSARALVLSTRRAASPAAQSEIVMAPTRTAAAAGVPAERPAPERLLSNARVALDLPGRAIASIGKGSSFRAGGAMAVALLTMAIAGLVYLMLVALRVRRITRSLETREVNGRDVLVSDHVGPALVGVIRPRIVIPRWVLSLEDAERRIILAHEQEHAEVHDPAMLAGAALLLAVAPWNLALWVMFARLRLAIEVDCDRRVLGSHRDARRYGDLLVTVYERTASAGMQLAFVARPSNLERRIRRLMDHTPRLSSGRGIGASIVALGLLGVACGTSLPTENVREASTARASVVGALPRCFQSSGRVTFEEMKDSARARRPELLANIRGRETIIGLLLDEHCAVVRDTAVSVANWQRPNFRAGDVFQIVFGDTTGLIRNRGMTFMYSADRKSFVTVAYAVKMSTAWRTRLSRTACGIGIRFDEACFTRGPLIVRMLDSVHALVAVRGFRAPNRPVDDLFLITLSRPNAAFASQSMEHGVVSFQSGALYFEDFLAREPRRWVGTPTSTGLAVMKTLPDVRVVSDIIGIAHHTGLPLTLEQVARLRPAARCTLPGSCYEVDGQAIEFP